MLATSTPAKIGHSRFDHHMEFGCLSSFVSFGEISALMHFAFLLSLCPGDRMQSALFSVSIGAVNRNAADEVQSNLNSISGVPVTQPAGSVFFLRLPASQVCSAQILWRLWHCDGWVFV
jgi:hypothetical protein